jgi:hypothetical protein
MKPTDGLSIAAILAKELYGETLEDHENLFMEAFEKELATLPEVNRIAIHLRFFEKLPYRVGGWVPSRRNPMTVEWTKYLIAD